MFDKCPDFVRQLIEYLRRFFADITHDHPDYVNPDLSGYVTDQELADGLATKADDPHTHPEYVNPGGGGR